MMATRVSIKPYLSAYLADFALEELGTDDISEAVNQIILDHKRGKCSCSSAVQEPVPRQAIASITAESDLLRELEALPGMSD